MNDWMHKKKGKMEFGMDTSEQPHQAEQFSSKKIDDKSRRRRRRKIVVTYKSRVKSSVRFYLRNKRERTGDRAREKRVRLRVCDIVNSIYWVRVIHFKIYVLSCSISLSVCVSLSFFLPVPYSMHILEYNKRKYGRMAKILYCCAIVLIGVNLISASVNRCAPLSSHI